MNTVLPDWDERRTGAEYWTVVDTDAGQLTVYVEKVGGGTLGREYVGAWNIEVQDNSHSPNGLPSVDYAYWVPVNYGTPKSHDDIAQDAAEYVSDKLRAGEEYTL